MTLSTRYVHMLLLTPGVKSATRANCMSTAPMPLKDDCRRPFWSQAENTRCPVRLLHELALALPVGRHARALPGEEFVAPAPASRRNTAAINGRVCLRSIAGRRGLSFQQPNPFCTVILEIPTESALHTRGQPEPSSRAQLEPRAPWARVSVHVRERGA